MRRREGEVKRGGRVYVRERGKERKRVFLREGEIDPEKERERESAC